MKKHRRATRFLHRSVIASPQSAPAIFMLPNTSALHRWVATATPRCSWAPAPLAPAAPPGHPTRGHRVVTTGSAAPTPRARAMPHGPRLVRTTRPTRPYGQQRELGCHAVGPVALGRRPAQRRFNLFSFLFSIGLNNSRNSIKFLNYKENKIKIIKMQNRFP
jgi:hypothetical protein